MGLEPVEEVVGIDGRFQWEFPPPGGTGPDPGSGSRSGSAALSVWYFALPLTSAHRGGHPAAVRWWTASTARSGTGTRERSTRTPAWSR